MATLPVALVRVLPSKLLTSFCKLVTAPAFVAALAVAVLANVVAFSIASKVSPESITILPDIAAFEAVKFPTAST